MRFLYLVPFLATVFATDSDPPSDMVSGSETEPPSLAAPLDTTSVRSQDIQFLTQLVSDVRANGADYFMFLRTADVDIPSYFGSLAAMVFSYSDDSFTTLLEDPDFPISSIEEFATRLDWYDDRLSVSGINEASTDSESSEGGASVIYAPIGFGVAAAVLGLL